MTLVSLRGVGKRYGRVVALDGIDLDIPREGRTAIVGASGSGKSTMLRLIAGFERPDAGRIALDGETLADDTTLVPAHRRGIGYVAQDGALFPHLTVAANVGFAIPRSDATRKTRIAKLLDLVQLDQSLATRRPHELSGGQQQRVALARALAMQPRLVLLDEPFSALDAGLRENLRLAVADVLATAGISTVLVTHDQAEALSFATHLAILRDGRLVQAGAPQELYRAPRDPMIAEFLGDAIVLPADVRDGTADTPFGRIAVSDAARAGRALLLLRPEQLRFRPLSEDPAGVVAEVLSATFAGATTAVRLAVGEGAPFTCRIAGPPPLQGDRLAVAVTGIVHVFPAAPP